MKRAWQTLVSRLDALAQRERIALFAAAALAIVAAVYVAAIEPLQLRTRQLAALAADRERLLASAQAQQREITAMLAQDPDAALRERIGQKQREVAAIDTRLADLQRKLVAPERMPRLLRELMSREPGVQLVSLRNLPPTSLLPAAQDRAGEGHEPAGAGRNVYRHGVEIVVKGRYLDLLAYVARLERQPWQVLWGKAVLAADYPTVVVSLTLYTLSLDKTWLVV